MKHLILFEDISNHDYYHFWGDSYSLDIWDTSFIPFNKSTKEEISKLLPDYSFKYERAKNHGGPVLEFLYKDPKVEHLNGLNPYRISVRQLFDEWFFIHFFYMIDKNKSELYMKGRLSGRSEVYKCDQISGIEKLLKDKHII